MRARHLSVQSSRTLITTVISRTDSPWARISSRCTLVGMTLGVASALLFLSISPSLLGQIKATSAESEVQDALANFIHSFDNLDWDSFRLAFSDDATVFYPRAFPERANGRAEFEKTFQVVFGQIRAGKTGAPYMDIQPRDMRIQLFGPVAIATFHLDDKPGFLNRRTLVLNKTNAGWKIVHLHASEVALTRQP
jgi:ketosteroid isomerase-like protein